MSENKNLVVVNTKPQLPMVIEENSLYNYLEQIKRFPILTEEEEKELITNFQTKGDLVSAQKLITSHLRLAAKIALTAEALFTWLSKYNSIALLFTRLYVLPISSK